MKPGVSFAARVIAKKAFGLGLYKRLTAQLTFLGNNYYVASENQKDLPVHGTGKDTILTLDRVNTPVEGLPIGASFGFSPLEVGKSATPKQHFLATYTLGIR